MTPTRRLRRWRDQMAAWTPALLMAAFALGTWWLVRNAPQASGPVSEAQASHEPDYYMRDFAIKSFHPDGRLKSQIQGTESRHFPDTDSFEVDAVRLRAIDEAGRVILGSARRGLSNADGTDVQLVGDARVVREAGTGPGGRPEPRLEFNGEQLRALVEQDRVESDLPVELVRGGARFTGDTFDYSRETGVANLKGRVRGVISPP